MKSEQLAVVRGWADTRDALRDWRARPLATLTPWAAGSLAVTLASLLVATWVVATLNVPGESGCASARDPCSMGDGQPRRGAVAAVPRPGSWRC